MKLSIFKRALHRDIHFIRVVYVVLLVATIGLAFWISKNKYSNTANVVIHTFQNRDSILQKAVMGDTSNLPVIKTLQEQFLAIGEIKKSYLFMVKRFNTYGYTMTVFFAFSSILSGILAFLLLRKGWDATDSFYLKSTFLIVFFCTTLFGILPNVFNTKENSKNNLTKYNYFSGLQLDIYDLVKDNRGFIRRNTSASKDSLQLIISSINRNMKENQDLYFDIFIDKVPSDIKPLKQ